MAQEKNPMIEINKRAMEHIWRTVPKEEKNGVQYVVYVKGDIPFLYHTGLVDTERYTLEDWQKAFDPHLGEDGRYWISHETMLALGRFRYSKVVNEPFDPLKMHTGRYTVERLWQIYLRSIIPSCSLPKDFIESVFKQIVINRKSINQMIPKEQLKKLKTARPDLSSLDVTQKLNFESLGKEEYINIQREDLLNFKKLLDTFPSPRRLLEMAVYERRMERLQELADIAAKPQKSSYDAGPDFRKTTQTTLKDMLVKASEDVTGGRKPMDEVIDLKALQKKRPAPKKF